MKIDIDTLIYAHLKHINQAIDNLGMFQVPENMQAYLDRLEEAAQAFESAWNTSRREGAEISNLPE